jgi:hypothetical protein
MAKFILLTITCLFVFGCYNESDCPDKTLIPLSVYPIKSVYQVGDTIEFRSVFSAVLKDVNGNTFNYGMNEWKNNFAIVPLEPLGEKFTRTSEFIEIISLDQYSMTHYFSQQSDSYDGIYSRNNDSLHFVIRGVLIKPGIIRTTFGIGTGVPEGVSRSCIRGWKNASLFRTLLNEGVNYNFEVFDEILDEHGNKKYIPDPMDYNEHGSYVIKIIP